MKFKVSIDRRTNRRKGSYAQSDCGKYRIAECVMKNRTKYICYNRHRILGVTYEKNEAIEICRGDKNDKKAEKKIKVEAVS